MAGGELAANQPVNSNDAFDSAGPDAACHLLGYLKPFSGDACDQLILDNHEGSPIVKAYAAGVTLTPTSVNDILNGAGSDTFVFSGTVGHAAVSDFKAAGLVGHDVSQIEATVAAGVAHPSVHIVGHDTIIDPGHEASITLTGVAS